MSKDWIQTYSGRKFYPLDPKPDDIFIEDIAHSLANQCRFNGHSRKFYSVAEHSVYVSTQFLRREARLIALLHDASEAYLCDIPAPLKAMPSFNFYREAETRLQLMIWHKFGVNRVESEMLHKIHSVDKRMCQTEAISFNVMAPLHQDWDNGGFEPINDLDVACLRPEDAEELFLGEFIKLTTYGSKTVKNGAVPSAQAA